MASSSCGDQNLDDVVLLERKYRLEKKNYTKPIQIPSLDLRQDCAVSAPGESVVGKDIRELAPQTQALRVSTDCLGLDGLHHLGFCINTYLDYEVKNMG